MNYCYNMYFKADAMSTVGAHQRVTSLGSERLLPRKRHLRCSLQGEEVGLACERGEQRERQGQVQHLRMWKGTEHQSGWGENDVKGIFPWCRAPILLSWRGLPFSSRTDTELSLLSWALTSSGLSSTWTPWVAAFSCSMVPLLINNLLCVSIPLNSPSFC